MRHRASWLAGVLVLVGAGPAAAQTGAGGTTTPIPRMNYAIPSTAGAGGWNLTAPIPKAGGTATGGSSHGFGAKHTGTGSTTGAGGVGGGVTNGSVLRSSGTGGSVLTGGGTGGSVLAGGSPLTAGDQVALLVEARLLVTELESTGNLSLSRRESMFLTLLVYEALRHQASQAGSGTGAAPPTGSISP